MGRGLALRPLDTNMNIFLELSKIVWFLLPGGFASIAAGISGKLLPRLNYPLDFYLKFRGKRIFGDHKTIRGVVIGIIVGLVVYILQDHLIVSHSALKGITLPGYEHNLLLGTFLPLGALLGDAIKSFFKRQINVDPGKSWFPFDQIDWLLGSFLFAYPFIKLELGFVLTVLLVGLLLHILVKLLGFALHLQDTWL